MVLLFFPLPCSLEITGFWGSSGSVMPLSGFWTWLWTFEPSVSATAPMMVCWITGDLAGYTVSKGGETLVLHPERDFYPCLPVTQDCGPSGTPEHPGSSLPKPYHDFCSSPPPFSMVTSPLEPWTSNSYSWSCFTIARLVSPFIARLETEFFISSTPGQNQPITPRPPASSNSYQ